MAKVTVKHRNSDAIYEVSEKNTKNRDHVNDWGEARGQRLGDIIFEEKPANLYMIKTKNIGGSTRIELYVNNTILISSTLIMPDGEVCVYKKQ